MKAVLAQFGLAVRTRRQELGLSQNELAARSGLHPAYIGGVERGERNLTLINVIAIAAALETSASDLLSHVEGSHRSGKLTARRRGAKE